MLQPGCLESLRKGGYEKPIYIQTQVGVDETIFVPDLKLRSTYKKKIGFEDDFVIGYTGRLTVDKGVDDLVSVFIALAQKKSDLALLLVGNGELREVLDKQFLDAGLSDRVFITGFVDQADVPNYMNAMDVFVLGSKTMPHWIDTFPLVTVQAQAIGIPVIASDSASIPWQLADTAGIYLEGNRAELKQMLYDFIENKQLRENFSERGRRRSLENFCHAGMTENFKLIVEQIMSEKPCYHEENDPYTQWKAY